MALFGKAKGVPATAAACIAFIMLSGLYVSLCERGGVGMCPLWNGKQQDSPATPRCIGGDAAANGGSQILGSGGDVFLPPDALQRGTSNYGSGRRMQRLGHKLLAGAPITVAFLGGSITWGRGAVEGGSFVARFSQWLNATFPHPDHRVLNHGLPAVTSALFAACFDKVPQDTDLVVLDFAVNDAHVPPADRDRQGYAQASGARRGFEQLLRQSLKLRGAPAVALLHFFSWNSTRDKQAIPGAVHQPGLPAPSEPVGDSYFWRSAEDDLSLAGQYYDAPVLSLRNAAYHLLREQRPGFQWHAGVHDFYGKGGAGTDSPLLDSLFFWDENHPWDRTGHRAMAELLEAAVSRGVMAAAAEAAAAAQQDGALGAELSLAPAPVLPPPMITDNYEANATSCHLQEDFKSVFTDTQHGFTYEPRAPAEATFIAQKWGLSASAPGATTTLLLNTQLGGAGSKLASVQVHLMYLRSWRGMGRASVQCAGGCKCEGARLEGHWDREATLTDLQTLQVSAHPKCRLVVTVLEGSASGGGHAFSLSGAVVSAVAAKMERGKIGQWDYDKGAT